MIIINTHKKTAIFRGTTPIFSSILAGILVGVAMLGIIMPSTTNADFARPAIAAYAAKQSNEEAKKAVIKTLDAVLTGYSSTPDQTDDTPFITASGKQVAEHIVANNMLPFGTKIRIPKLFGNKVFIVGDRMNKRMGNHKFDLWFPSRELALNFGVKSAQIEVLEN